MLRSIEQKFNNKSRFNSPTNGHLAMEQGKSTSTLESSINLTDGDHEFLFNQLLEGVAHGWHQVRIAKFFEQLEERGESQKWIDWLKRFHNKFPDSPNPAQRQLGARMIRLGELIKSEPKLKAIGAVSDEIGRKLFFGNITKLIWEYDGADIISTSAPESEVSGDSTPELPAPKIDPDSTIIQDSNLTVLQGGNIGDNSGELDLETADIISTPASESEVSGDSTPELAAPKIDPDSTVIEDGIISDNSGELDLEPADIILTPAPESEVSGDSIAQSPAPTIDPDSTLIQYGIISQKSGELDVDTEEFPLISVDEEDPSLIQPGIVSENSGEDFTETEDFPLLSEDEPNSNQIISNNSETSSEETQESKVVPHQTEDPASSWSMFTKSEEAPSFYDDEVSLTSEELVFPHPENLVVKDSYHITSEELESPWEQPELPADSAKNPSKVEDSTSDPSLIESIKELQQAQDKNKTNLTLQQLVELLQKKQNSEQQASEQPSVDRTDPDVVASTAIQKVDNSRQLSPNSANLELVESWFELGLKQASAGALENAIASWYRVLEYNPRLTEVWHNCGSALGRLGKYPESIIAFEQALEIDPNNYQAWNDRAHAFYLMENWQEAIESWDKAISLMPNNHQFWYNRGRAQEKLKLIQESISSYEKALEIQPDFKPAKSRYLNLLADK